MESIDERIRNIKKKISKKQKEIDDLKQDILALEILKLEQCISKPVYGEEYFAVPKRVLESYFESLL